MSDSGNIDSNPYIKQIGFDGSAKKAKPNTESQKPSTNKEVNKSEAQNRGVYKKPASSQIESQTKTKDSSQLESSKKSKTGLNKDYEIKSSNPTLAAKMENKKKPKAKPPKNKQNPPDPSMQVQYSPKKGIAINPRKVQPSIPGRLQAFFDDQITNLEKLAEALEPEGMYSENLTSHYTKKLLSENLEANSRMSLAQLLDLDESIVDLSKTEMLRMIAKKSSLLGDEPALKDFLAGILSQLMAEEGNPFIPLLQLFMPLPLPYLFAEIDEDFERSEEEVLDDEEKSKDQDQDESEEEEEPEFTASISIKTLNFNQLHFLVKYFSGQNRIKLNIKGAPISTELVIPIETHLEDAIECDVNDIDYLITTWGENVLRITESRVLKVKSTGNLNSLMLRACNSILETIHENDIDLSSEDTIEGEFNVI